MTLQHLAAALLCPAAAVVIIAVRWRHLRRQEKAGANEVAGWLRGCAYLDHLEDEMAGTVVAELAWMLAESAEEQS